jgi:hypothetical protein
MKVSFDLDGALFINEDMIDAEAGLKFPFKYFYKEKLRLGTIDIMKKIIKNDIDLWIYTTSFRSRHYIKKYFKNYGIKIKLKNIVNGQRHIDEIQNNQNETLPSKYPPKYNIDLHIDDDISIKQSGYIYGFKVFVLLENNINWVKELWEEILKIKSSSV